MPGTLQTLLAKLKKRRKSKAAAAPNKTGGHDERSGGLVITDGMANLTVSDSAGVTEPKNIITFGTSQEFDFSFSLDSAATWPGPDYDKTSLFAPGVFDKPRPLRPKSKHKSSKRKLSSEGGQLKIRQKEVPTFKIIRDISPSKKGPRPSHYYGTLPARDPPHHFLNLPGEIRNQIYRLLCVTSDPIVAQFRPIIKPKSGRPSEGKFPEAAKRFPREPALALVSRQIMKELLSIFYSENTFIFRRSDDDHFKDLIMTRPTMIRRWSPLSELACSISRIEVHFPILPSTGPKESVIYTLQKLKKGPLQVSSNEDTLAEDSCTCFDRRWITSLKQQLASEYPGAPMFGLLSFVPIWRTQALMDDETVNYVRENTFRPKKLICDECGLVTPRLLESGL